MGRVFDWLDRKFDDPVRDYDIRINSLAAFHAGYAFFSLINYEDDISAFHVYNVWNGEFNSKLVSALPAGGFMLHCDRRTAELLSEGNAGYPVFVKLKAKRGRLYVTGFNVTCYDMVMDMYFNGCEVIPPEYVYFRRSEIPDDAHHNEVLLPAEVPVYGGSRIPSSFRARGSYRGSYFISSFMRGSFVRSGSFMRGSGSSRIFGSAYTFTGSYRSSSFERALGGSYRSGSFRLGIVSGSFRHGSFSGILFNGSYYSGSYHRGSFVYGGGDGVSRYTDREAEYYREPDENRGNYRVRRLIEELGYGLDLI
ncbi:MAG: hypothetical protein K6B44_13360 [Lachnospiraceae bacterium]|nr:hypothetical protein [Lachnospiraceae bacterium]